MSGNNSAAIENYGGDVTVYGDVKDTGDTFIDGLNAAVENDYGSVEVKKDSDGNGGNIISTGKDTLAVMTDDQGTVIVEDSIKKSGAGDAVEIRGGGSVYVGKDITVENGSAVVITDTEMETEHKESVSDYRSVTVLGDVGGTIQVLIREEVPENQEPGIAAADEELKTTVLSNVGTIVVGSVTTDDSIVKVTDYDGTMEHADIEKAIEEQKVYYIVNTEKVEHGTITVTKASNVENVSMVEVKDAKGNILKDANGQTLYAANQTETVEIKIAAADGYEVKSTSGGKATLTKNEDGTYTLTVPTGGGIDISAVIQAIYNGNGGGSDSDDSGSSTGSYTGSSSSVDKWEWFLIDGLWYVKNQNGVKKTGWYHDPQDGCWYYLNPEDGAMATGWTNLNGKSYYLNPTAPAWSWAQRAGSGSWYFLNNGIRPLGSMYANEKTPDGRTVGADGAEQ